MYLIEDRREMIAISSLVPDGWDDHTILIFTSNENIFRAKSIPSQIQLFSKFIDVSHIMYAFETVIDEGHDRWPGRVAYSLVDLANRDWDRVRSFLVVVNDVISD